MPYPILTLPYPFAKRLQQLLSPFELQNLQIAAAHFKGPLEPVVMTSKVYRITFEGDTSDVINLTVACNSLDMKTKTVNIGNEKVVYQCPHASFNSLSNAVFDNICFNNLYYAAKIVCIKYCKVSLKFLENIAARFKITNLRDLYIREGNEIDNDVKISTVYKMFPFLKTLSIATAYNGWIRELLDPDFTTEIEYLLLRHDSLDELLSFNTVDFHRLVEKHPRLNLYMVYKVPGQIHESKEYFEMRIKKAFSLHRFNSYGDFYLYFEVSSVNDTPEQYFFWYIDRIKKL
uniref:F-box domain-containing protein n=1 Tax=Panagrellus redivivus TaxID=6233 RepID=A0A7E4UV52_PANRE